MWNSFALVVALTAGGPADEPHGPPAPASDRNGFSLPPGAVARLGDPTRRHRYPSEWASFSDDDRLLARPVDGFVTIFDLETKRDVTPGYLKDHPAAVLRFLPGGRHLLFSPTSKRVEVRDPTTGQVGASFEVPPYSTTPDLALPSADGRRVLVRFRDGSGYSCATVADLSESPPVVRTLRGTSSSDQWAMSADGKLLTYVGRREGRFRVQVLDLASGQETTVSDSAQDESPSFAPNGRQVLYATEIGGRGVLATATIDGRVRTRLAGPQGDVREPAWGPFVK